MSNYIRAILESELEEIRDERDQLDNRIKDIENKILESDNVYTDAGNLMNTVKRIVCPISACASCPFSISSQETSYTCLLSLVERKFRDIFE